MRTNVEIDQAIGLLRMNENPFSEDQINVLVNRMSEGDVFKTYAIVPEDVFNSEKYYACRDAAKYLHGSLSLSDLTDMSEEKIAEVLMIPSVKPWSIPEETKIAFSEVGKKENELEPFITISLQAYEAMIARIERLEKWTGLNRKAEKGNIKPKALPSSLDLSKMVSQNEACKLLKCGKNTIKRYASRGLIKSYKNGRYTYYVRQELVDKIINRNLDNNG